MQENKQSDDPYSSIRGIVLGLCLGGLLWTLIIGGIFLWK